MPVIEDGFGRLIDRGDRLLRPFEDVLNFVAAMAVLFLMGLGVVQVVMRLRWLFRAPIFGYIDMIELAMPILAVLGIAYCQRHGVHIRMDILIQNLRGRALWVIETVNAAIMLLIAALLTFYSYDFFMSAYTSGDSTVDAQYLTWPSKLLVPVALALLSLRLVVQLFGCLRLAIDPHRDLVGVIKPMDVAEQAQEEIREALGEEGKQ